MSQPHQALRQVLAAQNLEGSSAAQPESALLRTDRDRPSRQQRALLRQRRSAGHRAKRSIPQQAPPHRLVEHAGRHATQRQKPARYEKLSTTSAQRERQSQQPVPPHHWNRCSQTRVHPPQGCKTTHQRLIEVRRLGCRRLRAVLRGDDRPSPNDAGGFLSRRLELHLLQNRWWSGRALQAIGQRKFYRSHIRREPL